MKPDSLLALISRLSIVLMTLHLSDDTVRGISGAGPENLIGVAIMVVWLYGTVMLRDRLAGCVTVLLGSLLAAAMPVLHMSASRLR